MSLSSLAASFAACLTLAACTIVTVPPPAPEPVDAGPSTAVTLGVPPGHLPPVGMCRVWIRGRPPGRQPRPRTCDNILANAPAGAMILYRPTESRRLVRVRYVDNVRVGVIVRIRLFEAASGKFLREERRGNNRR